MTSQKQLYPLVSRSSDTVGHYIQFKRPEYFDIYKIFDCGQCFRFDQIDGGIAGIACGEYVYFTQTEDTVRIYGCTEEKFNKDFAHYLGLDYDYEKINEDIFSHFPKGVMQEAEKVSRGIRILCQPLWETLCSFIISQNNNIPRIKKIISSISAECGSKIYCFDGKTRFDFPSAEQLLACGEGGLRDLKTGFRAKYLIDCAKKWRDGRFDGLHGMSYSDAKNALLSVKGIGEKVANCVLLFAGEKYNAFPVDVWIKKVIDKYYGGELDINGLGNYAGVGQQYLFYYERYIQNGRDIK